MKYFKETGQNKAIEDYRTKCLFLQTWTAFSHNFPNLNNGGNSKFFTWFCEAKEEKVNRAPRTMTNTW